MALYILNRAQNSSIHALSDTGFTKVNGTNTNTTIGVDTPKGVLGGSVAAFSGEDYVAVACNMTLQPAGLFVNDAAGAAWENSPAVASGKVAVCKGMASVEVDVYETRNAADTADITYAVGDKMYSSAQGLLTNEESTSAVVVGICTKVPTVASPKLGLEMRV